MRNSFGTTFAVSILATLAVGLTACSSGTNDTTPARGAATSASHGTKDHATKGHDTTGGKPAAAAGLAPFLLQRGEEPGFAPSGSVGTEVDVNRIGAQEGLSAADTRRMRDRGFRMLMFRPLDGAHGVGVTSLMLFRTTTGAKSQAAEDRRDLEIDFTGWTVKRFAVPGVPGAFGWTATKPGNRVGNVRWVEGRCILTIGNAEAPSFIEPLRAGVLAMHRRIAGKCPCT